MRAVSFIVGFAGIGLFALSVLGQHDPALPDPKLTPGAVRSTSSQEICARGYDQAHRVWHDKNATLAKYGYGPADRWRFEDDDLIPVCLGGDNANPANHWLQPCDRWEGDRCIAGDAADKDHREAATCRQICYEMRAFGVAHADRVLAQLQHYFAVDWRMIQY